MSPLRRLGTFVLGLLLVLGLLAMPSTATQAGTPGPAASAAEGPGPAMSTPASARRQAVTCDGDPATAGPVPVLLVPGTALTAEENWGSSYRPALRAAGHAVCVVELPGHATGDVQRTVEFVATAIRVVSARAERRIAVIGHSQGAMLPRLALRVWPDLAARVDDVVGLAGVYDAGSAELAARCTQGCVPAMHQLAAGSRLLRAVARRTLPSGPDGPSYSNIGTAGDTTVTPQPAANRQRGATSILIQDVCPGRTIPASEHGLIVGDAAARALVDDALAHPGPAAASRVDPAVCEQVFYPGFVPSPFLQAAPFVRERLGNPTADEAPLRCHLRPDCADVLARGAMLTAVRMTGPGGRGGTRTWTAVVRSPGALRITFDGRRGVRAVTPGRVTLTLSSSRPGLLRVETRPRHYTAWAPESRIAVR